MSMHQPLDLARLLSSGASATEGTPQDCKCCFCRAVTQNAPDSDPKSFNRAGLGRDGSIPDASSDLLRKAKTVMQLRRLRIEALGEDLFFDPAWDMMLDIFVCDLTQQRNPTSVVGRSAGIPHSTALRWLAALERRNLIKREPDRTDARRVYVALTTEGFTKMRLWMESELLQGL